ncbi:hypothetical protein AB0I53_36805 [Saccharopolyspora sp. NPDC050389]|uniref:hypothetical protein n=1 Tax=Saccharopolyspora sp. NPDC050389 TaxID=3155516 RepID=UPI00340F309E
MKLTATRVNVNFTRNWRYLRKRSGVITERNDRRHPDLAQFLVKLRQPAEFRHPAPAVIHPTAG